MKIEHAVMRLKWMIFGVALLLGCVLFNQVTLLELVWLSLPVALVGFIMVQPDPAGGGDAEGKERTGGGGRETGAKDLPDRPVLSPL